MPQDFRLTRPQYNLVRATPKGATFLEGPAGTGKTVVGVERLRSLLDKKNIDPGEILVLTPQQALGEPYEAAVIASQSAVGGQVNVTTLGSLALRTVDLFWPLVASSFGFGRPAEPPTFLTLETAQYYMARVLEPFIERESYFTTVHLDRNRLYSQILDNLNKAAVVGFPHTQIAELLKAAWTGDDGQRLTYEEAQACAEAFRAYCLAHNLLDFSLQIEVFRALWNQPDSPVRAHLVGQYHHLIVDNIEEERPILHAVLRDWLPQCTSALLIYDQDAGYRQFLGADPTTAYALKALCDKQVEFTESFVISEPLAAFAGELALSLDHPAPAMPEADPLEVVNYDLLSARFHPEMLDAVAETVAELVLAEDVLPENIVVLAPFLSDALRFSLVSRLTNLDVPVRSHRPSRALREEPAARCLLTLARLAHPQWKAQRPDPYHLAYALETAIEGLDMVRAQLLAGDIHRSGSLIPFEGLGGAEKRDRITYRLGVRYDGLRNWLTDYVAGEAEPLDIFWSRLFGEVLSQPGYGFHNNNDAARVAANLVDSAREFRWTVNADELQRPVAHEYVESVSGGLIANQYVRDWQTPEQGAVLLSSAYTFLMSNQAVDYQFWLNVGSNGWWERLYQPLTHPYVLSRAYVADGFAEGRKWTDADEIAARNETLYRSVVGLVRRCRSQVFLAYSELGEQGLEQRGRLLEAIQRMLRRRAGRLGEGV